MENKYKFVKRWNVPSTLSSKKIHILELNKIIDQYNDWQIHDNFDPNKIKILLDSIEFFKTGLVYNDGLEEIEEMEEFVKSFEVQ